MHSLFTLRFLVLSALLPFLSGCSDLHRSAIPSTLLISHIDYPSDKIGSGAGCYFVPASEGETNFVFIDDAATGPWMKIYGKNTSLESIDGTWPALIGETRRLTLRAPGVVVEFSVEKTTQCVEGKECGGESFAGVITVNSGQDTQSVRVSGGCGC